MNTRIHLYSPQEIEQFITEVTQAPTDTKNYYLAKFVISNLTNSQYLPLCLSILAEPGNGQVSMMVLKDSKFVGILRRMLMDKKSYRLMSLAVGVVDEEWLDQIEAKLIADSLLEQFNAGFVDIECAFGSKFDTRTV